MTVKSYVRTTQGYLYLLRIYDYKICGQDGNTQMQISSSGKMFNFLTLLISYILQMLRVCHIQGSWNASLDFSVSQPLSSFTFSKF